MVDIIEAIAGKSKELLETNDNLREIFIKHFDFREKDPQYNAMATEAVETCVSIANIFLSVKRANSNRGFAAINDLVFHLNTNAFWNRNSNILVPAISMGLNAHRDYANMLLIKASAREYAAYDILMSGAQAVPLEIFGLILFLVGGPKLMNKNSLLLKEQLAPYFLGN